MPKATFNNLPPEKNSCAKRFAEDFFLTNRLAR